MHRHDCERVILPAWPAPARVRALITTRRGGVSGGPYQSFNLGDHVGDNPRHVELNRRCLLGTAGPGLQAIQWLKQVHGIAVCEAQPDEQMREADASFTRRPRLGCAVMTADCLPVFFCNAEGTQVAVAHAGWRGLLLGVLEATVARFAPADSLLVYLGPAIGPQAFEVGLDVYSAFCALNPAWASAFVPSPHAERWYADIYQLARWRLQEAGVSGIFGGDYCTFSDPERFFSYRRDGLTGRMTSLIWLES